MTNNPIVLAAKFTVLNDKLKYTHSEKLSTIKLIKILKLLLYYKNITN